MRSLNRISWIVAVLCALCGMRAQADPQAEKGDAVFRNLVVLGITVGHAGIYWGYYISGWPDNQFRHTVIQAVGTGSSSASTVSYSPFDDESYPPTFLSGNTYWGARNRSSLSPATWNGSANSMSAARRDSIITEAQQLIGTAYCWYNIWDNSLGLDGTVSCEPTNAYPTYPSYIRCDGVVQWVYNRVGFNMGDRYTSILDASPYPINRMSRFYAASVDTPSTTLQDNGSTYTITAYDNSSTPTKVNIVYPSGTTGFFSSPATITKQVGTTFYQGVDLAGHAESWKQVYYSQPGQPDLTIVQPVLVSPTSVVPGGTIRVDWTEKNQGTAASTPAHNTKLFLSTSAYGTTYQIGYYGPMNTLGVGATASYYDANIVVPTTIPAGNYYVTAFIDCDQQVSESNENNNIGSSSPTMLTVTPNNISVTVQPSLSGRSFTVDGNTYTTAQTFSWVSGNSHTIATTSPQSGGTGIQFFWSGWSDGGAISHTVSPTVGTTYTANFTTQYYLTTGYGTGGNGVSPGSEWCNSGASVGISATPASGYSFSSWTGSGSGSYSGSINSTSITMNGPITETASFVLIPDTQGPALAITSPINNATVTSASLPVSGTASDNGYGNNGISSVTVNGGSASGGTASGAGTANWSATIPLNAGANTVTVVAKDTLNNSTQKVVSVTYNPPRPTFGGSSVTGGKLQTTLTGLSVGENIVFYVSSDLKIWTPLQTNSVLTGSTLTFTNTINPAMKNQFFRAVVQ